MDVLPDAAAPVPPENEGQPGDLMDGFQFMAGDHQIRRSEGQPGDHGEALGIAVEGTSDQGLVAPEQLFQRRGHAHGLHGVRQHQLLQGGQLLQVAGRDGGEPIIQVIGLRIFDDVGNVDGVPPIPLPEVLQYLLQAVAESGVLHDTAPEGFQCQVVFPILIFMQQRHFRFPLLFIITRKPLPAQAGFFLTGMAAKTILKEKLTWKGDAL